MPEKDPRRVYDGRYMGLAKHQFIGQRVRDGDAASDEGLYRRAAEHASAQGPTTYARAAVQRLVTAASVYDRCFRPPAGWSLAGMEVPVGRRRLDLLWQRNSAMFADELKTGPSSLMLSEQTIAKQARAQLAAASREFGEQFLGIRVLLLSEPRHSYWLYADGTQEPVLEVLGVEITTAAPAAH